MIGTANMIMAMPLKPAPNLGVISIYRKKLSYIFTLLVIEMVPQSSYML